MQKDLSNITLYDKLKKTMKQHISLKQWQELSLARQRKFQEVSKKGGLPTIGRMIEFLLDYERDSRYKKPQPISFYQKQYLVDEYENQWWKIVPEELCDDLWEAVKEVLKNQN